MKSLHRILFALFLAVSAISGCTDPVEEIPVTISLNKTLMSALPVGSQQQLEAVVKPEGADVTVVWESDNEAVATVDAEGTVTGVSVGTAVITASAGDASAECKVTVVALKPTAISLTPTKLQMKPGDTSELAVAFTPAEAVAEDLVWETSDASVAAVKDGVVTAAGVGEATVTVKCNGGNLAAVCHVNVAEDYVPVYVTEIQLTPAEMSLEAGQKKTIEVTYLPADAEEVTDLEWETSDADVAKVENGTVEAVKAGKAVITAKCMDGTVTATCQVTVSEKEEPEPGPGDSGLQAVAINALGGKADVQVGMELQLELACTPSTAVPSSVTWSVDTDMFATIDGSGLLKGKYAEKDASGWKSVVVTVNADGKEASLVVRVIPRQAEEIRVDVPEKNLLKVGSEWTFNPVIYPEGLPFSVMAISNPYSALDGACYIRPETPGRYNYTFTLAGHEDLVSEYNVKTVVDIDVEPYWVETIVLPSTYDMEAGSTGMIIPEFTSDVEGHQPTYKAVAWSSSDNEVATVNERTGEITALKAGTVEITATTSSNWSVPSGTAHKSATCVVTVKEPALAINIGDYYYSDGTWSSELDESKTVIGIVFSKANAVSSDSHLAADYPGCTHGLVISTEEYLTACATGRSWSWADLGQWCSDNGYGQYYDLDKPVGYSNTEGYEAANAAAVQSYGYTIDFTMFNSSSVLKSHRDSVASPSSASCWYIPSYKEMAMLYENVTLVNERLEAVGGDAVTVKRAFYDDISYQYWCSTFDLGNKVIRAFSMLNGDWHGSKTEGTQLGCRIVLAF